MTALGGSASNYFFRSVGETFVVPAGFGDLQSFSFFLNRNTFGAVPNRQLDASLDALEKSAEGKVTKKDYNGVEYLTDESGGDTNAGAVFDGYLVLGNEPGVRAAIDAGKGKAVLATMGGGTLTACGGEDKNPNSEPGSPSTPEAAATPSASPSTGGGTGKVLLKSSAVPVGGGTGAAAALRPRRR